MKASPRVYYGRNVPKGGGRDVTGKPYKVKGKWYVPKEDKKYDKMGSPPGTGRPSMVG